MEWDVPPKTSNCKPAGDRDEFSMALGVSNSSGNAIAHLETSCHRVVEIMPQ
jgi:hypothetical protein